MINRLATFATLAMLLLGCGGPADSDRDARPAPASSQVAEVPKPAPQEEPTVSPSAEDPPADNSPRNWTNIDGKLLTTGELVDVIEGKACLQKPEPGEKVVIPFDFVSKFDDGRYGKMVGEMIWKKLDRQSQFVIPETMLDVRDTCESNNLQLTPETPLPEVRKVLDETFAAHVAIWGSVERAAGHDSEVYDLVIKCVDFSAGSEPKVVYQRSARTNSVSEIPHLYVKEMLDALAGRKPSELPPLDPLAEENWQQKPSLIAGTFEQGAGGVPQDWASHWEAGEVNQREALGRTIQWIAEAGNSDNRVIRFTFDKALGDTTGVAYYSKFFPVEEGALYRFQCRWRSDGPKVKVFIKCYDEVGTTYHGKDARSPKGRGSYQPELGQIREVYRSQQNLKGNERSWNVQTEDFTPKHTKYTPRWGRVMLYAYIGAGVVEFDDVVVKQILPPYHTGRKVKRHSMESDVTVQEMEENQRRSDQKKERRERERRIRK